MYTILFPTDFSAPAAHALDYAVALAEKTAAKILLFHAVPVPLQDPNTFFKPAEIYSPDEAKTKLRALQQQVATKVSCDTVLRVGYSVNEAVEVMKGTPVDLVIMGTRGAGNTPDTLVGSTTVGFIEKAHRPILVIPIDAVFVAVQRIVLAADLKETKRATLTPLIAFARLFRAEVLVLNITPKEAEISEKKAVEALKLEDYLEEVPSSMHVVAHDDVAEGIEEFVWGQKAQMLSLVARKHGFFSSLFHESITRKMALHSETPILVLEE